MAITSQTHRWRGGAVCAIGEATDPRPLQESRREDYPLPVQGTPPRTQVRHPRRDLAGLAGVRTARLTSEVQPRTPMRHARQARYGLAGVKTARLTSEVQPRTPVRHARQACYGQAGVRTTSFPSGVPLGPPPERATPEE